MMREPAASPGLRRWLSPASDDSWVVDPMEALRRSQRACALAAAGLLAVAICEAVALATLVPLKSVVPYTILVDRQTGYVETVKGLQPGPMSEDQAVAQSAIVQYVIARETFDGADLRDNFRKASLWSNGEARQLYLHDMQRANPQSPLNQYPATTVVSTRIKSVSVISPGNALVRFDTIRRDQGALAGEQRSWTAVITYRFSGAPTTMEDRFLNPLGFQVTHYRRDAETVAPTPVRFDGPLGSANP